MSVLHQYLTFSYALHQDFFNPSWTAIERILNCSLDEENTQEDEDGTIKNIGRQFYIKWVGKNYSESTYEYEQDLILSHVQYLDHLASFKLRIKKPTKEDMKSRGDTARAETARLIDIFCQDEERESKIKQYQLDLENHVFKNGGKLRDYQAEGVSWLMANHISQKGSILADEMGLGKTIQTASYVNLVSRQLSTRGPFLIVAPLSTIPHWYREFTCWTDLNTIVYHGNADDRTRSRYDEFAFPQDRAEPEKFGYTKTYLNKVQKKWRSKWEKTWMVEVVITTPEMIVADDFKELAAIQWEILVVDEAHRKLCKIFMDKYYAFSQTWIATYRLEESQIHPVEESTRVL